MGINGLTTAEKVSAEGLVLAAAGIVIQIVAGSDLFPTIPPGPVILILGAGLIAFGPRSWARYVALIIPIFLLVGATTAGVVATDSWVDQLRRPEQTGIFLGTVLQFTAIAVALVAGIRIWQEAGRNGAPGVQRDNF